MDEKTLIERANEEREKLFQRYDRGREPGNEIDEWEDPGFEVYHQTDRYGFIHDKRLPQKYDANETKANSIEMERVKKWLKMTYKWESKETTEKLKKRVYKGIPDKLRSKVWMKLLNIEKTMSENKNVYQKMLKLARQWSTEARQIDSDVNRQFRENLFFRERYNVKQKSLFNVLTAYSMYNMEVGYCQGMSGLAGVLLMYLDEEESFWALSTLLADKKYAMHGLYIEGFPKLTRFLAHHDKIITKFIPKLKKHFDQYNLDSILYSLKWFFVIFVERIPFSLCLRVWDIYLLDGERVVIGMAYTILKLHKNKILKLKDMDLIVQYIQVKLQKDFGYDDDYVIKTLEQSLEELRKSKLDHPPPGNENELPKRPFGIFVEPSFEAKVGIRKSIFTETEKEVTEKVIMTREITAQEINEINLINSVNDENNAPLNTATVPDSEDGCSLIGSSRKSLADTSVTSTADLSIFSGGQRSQQAYDICNDDTHSVQSDGEGESSPGSAFCSLSVVGRTPSSIMITPTPRAMSPHDIVRIYVPPPPPEEIQKHQKWQEIKSNKPSSENLSKLSNKKMFSYETTNDSSKRNSIAGYDGITNRIQKNSIYQSEEELRQITEMVPGNILTSSSSSRRGSMTRKSPAVFEKDMPECSHLRSRKNSLSESLNNRIGSNLSLNDSNKVKLSVSGAGTDGENSTSYGMKKMTSFEELAKSKKLDDHKGSNIVYSIDKTKVENGSSSIDRSQIKYSNRSDARESTIRYRTLSPSGGSDKEFYPNVKTCGNNSSPHEYDTLLEKRKNIVMGTNKSEKYNRFFNNGKSFDDETDDDDLYKTINKSSDDSSSSPNSKSVLTTPVNETIPLLYSPVGGGVGIDRFNNISSSSRYKFSIEPSNQISSPTKNRFIVKTPFEDSGPESLDSSTFFITKNGSSNQFDNRISSDLGGNFSFKSNPNTIVSSKGAANSFLSATSRNVIGSSSQSSLSSITRVSASNTSGSLNDFESNKIRIKINNNQKDKGN